MSEQRARCDVLVSGGRCAGAATAMLLARQGMRVLMVERSRRGSDTLSTHALMRGAVVQLHRWGLLPQVAAADTPPVTTTSFHYGDEVVTVPIKSGQGVAGLFAPRRTVLDALLADAAEEAGARIRWGVRLKDLIRDSCGRVRGAVVQQGQEPAEQIRADLVVGADGVRSTVAEKVGAEVVKAGRHATGVVYGYWQGAAFEGYRWYYRRGVSAGVIPTNGGACVFISVPQSRFWNETRFDLEGGYHRVLQESAPGLLDELQQTATLGRLRGFAGQRGYLRRCCGPGWALVGDAGYFKDPLTAHGITDALRDAELVSRSLLAPGRCYQQIRDQLSLELFEITDAVASFEWDLPAVQQLHRRLSREMKREVAWLTGSPADH